MKILVSGGGGLLAHSLRELSPTCHGDVFIFLNHAEFDLTRPDLMAERLAQLQPDAVINAAAYNLVDRCEIERELSWSVNADAPGTLANLCAEKNIRLVHYLEESLKAHALFKRDKDYVVKNGGTITEAVSTQVWPGEAVVRVCIVNWVKGNAVGTKKLFTQIGDSKSDEWKCEELKTIPPTLASKTTVTEARTLAANQEPNCVYVGQ